MSLTYDNPTYPPTLDVKLLVGLESDTILKGSKMNITTKPGLNSQLSRKQYMIFLTKLAKLVKSKFPHFYIVFIFYKGWSRPEYS
jgi:hypothetical protein